MVEFTTNEILCYNSLLDGKKIQGIRLLFPPMTLKRKIIDDTVTYLRKENLAEESGNLTVVGEAKLHIIRKYKEAEKYLAINNMAISFQKGRSMIMAVQTKDDNLMLEAGERTAILQGLLKKYVFLQRNEECEEEQQTCILKDDDWENLIERIEMKNLILVQKYRNENLIENLALFCHDGSCYEYRVIEKKLIKKTASGIRKRLNELLEVEGE